MEYNQILVFVFLAIILKSVSSHDKTERKYIKKGREKIISLLEATQNEWTLDFNAQNFRNTIAQRYADQWSKTVLQQKFASNHTVPTLESQGINAIFGKRSGKTDKMGKFVTKKFDKWMETEILRIVNARTLKEEILIEIGIGYVHEELSKYSPSKLLLMFGITGVLQVHLVIVLMFSRHTNADVQTHLVNILVQETGNVKDATFKVWNPEPKKVAETWATVYADTGVKPNITSTQKHVWVNCFADVSVEKAESLIREFFKGYFHVFQGDFPIAFAWIQKIEYIYFGATLHTLEGRTKNKYKGYFVIATTFPQDFSTEQQNILTRRIPKFPTKYCPLAAEIAHRCAKRQSPLANKKSNKNAECVVELFTATIYFPVHKATATVISDTEIPIAVEEINFAVIEKLVSEIGHPTVGGAFGRLIERDTNTNEIKSVTSLVLIINSDTHNDTLQLTLDNLMGDTSTNMFFTHEERLHTRTENLKRLQKEVPKYFKWTENVYQTYVQAAEDYLLKEIRVLQSKIYKGIAGSRIEITEGENEDIFYILCVSEQLGPDKTVNVILKDIMKVFEVNKEKKTKDHVKDMKLLLGREGKDKLNLIEDVIVSGYSIRPCTLTARSGPYNKVLLVLTVPKTKI